MDSRRLESQFLIHLDRRKFAKVLGWVIFSLVLAHAVVQGVNHFVYELPWLFTDLFDLDEEQSFATWFSTLILFIASLLLFAVARLKRQRRGEYVAHWYGLAVGFAVLSMDELVGLHETVNTIIDMAWSILGGIVVLGVALAYLKFLLHLSARSRRLFLLAGAAFAGGAIAVELLGHYYMKALGSENFGYESLVMLEEMLEMLGVVILIHALLDYLTANVSGPVFLAGIKRDSAPAGKDSTEGRLHVELDEVCEEVEKSRSPTAAGV